METSKCRNSICDKRPTLDDVFHRLTILIFAGRHSTSEMSMPIFRGRITLVNRSRTASSGGGSLQWYGNSGRICVRLLQYRCFPFGVSQRDAHDGSRGGSGFSCASL